MSDTPDSMGGAFPPPKVRASRPGRFERRERAAADALRTALRDLHMDRFGAVLPRAEEIEFTFRAKCRPGEQWVLRFEPPLTEQAGVQLEEAQAGWGIYRAGRVYCFRCDSSACEHSRPPTLLSVFAGYAENGAAEWHDLGQAFLRARDSRVEQLFEEPPRVLALMEYGRTLRTRQLYSFGRASRTYSILGQVVAGYFLRPRGGAPPSADRRMALTFQVVETRNAQGRFALKLNLLAGLADEVALREWLVSEAASWVHRARDLAERELEEIERRMGMGPGGAAPSAADEMKRVPAVMRRLVEYIERGARQSRRRTRHAQDRRQAQRPIHAALEDARQAGAGSIFHDEKSKAFAVCGPQGRIHIFSRDGRHVTSFEMRPDAVAQRVRTRRWRPADADEVMDLRSAVARFVPAPNAPAAEAHAGGGGIRAVRFEGSRGQPPDPTAGTG